MKTLGYLDSVAMAQAESLVGRQDLLKAKEIAGRVYGRRLEHYFLLLKPSDD